MERKGIGRDALKCGERATVPLPQSVHIKLSRCSDTAECKMWIFFFNLLPLVRLKHLDATCFYSVKPLSPRRHSLFLYLSAEL